MPKPDADGSAASMQLRCELTRLEPVQYRGVVYRWPLADLLIYFEAARIQAFYDDLKEATDKAIRQFAGAAG